ncbi:MAG: hypothetical protein RI967_696 [Planctomycetota bacterium]
MFLRGYDAPMLRSTARAVACLSLAAAVLATGGCTTMSTYPPTAGKPATRPNISPGPELMTAALREAYRTTGLAGAAGGVLVFNLPAGLEPHTWQKVAAGLPDGARAMRNGDENVCSVQQIRHSGGRAEVDVVYPDRGVYQLLTVRLTNAGLAGWRVASTYRWLIPATAPLANDPMIAIEAERAAQEALEAERAATAAESARREAERVAAERAAAEAAAIEAAERAAEEAARERAPAAPGEPIDTPVADPASEPVPA